MKKPIQFRPTLRIASIMSAPGGITAGAAVNRAKAAVERVRERCVAALDDKIEVIWRLSGETLDAGVLRRAYAVATEIYALSATYGLEELAQAASSLCDLLSEPRAPTAIQPVVLLASAVRVHVDALRTLRRPDMSGDAAARAAVVTGLRRVVEMGKA